MKTNITRHKRGHFIMTTESVYQEDRIILDIYIYIIKLKWKLDIKITVRNSTLLFQKSIEQVVRRIRFEWHYQPTWPNWHLKILPTTNAEHTFFSNTNRIFTRENHIPDHKTSLNKFNGIQIIQNMSSDYNGVKLQINSRKIPENLSGVWKCKWLTSK